MDWLNDIPARVNKKDGCLELLPKNGEPGKSVKDVAPALEDAFKYIVENDFPGVLS